MHSILRYCFFLLLAVNLGEAFTVSSTATSSRLVIRGDRGKALAMSVTLDKDPIRTGGSTILDRPQAQERIVNEPTRQRKGQGHEAWEVRIYNDGLNTREHVARSLVQVTGMPEISAYQTMMQAHQNGMAVVGRWIYEVAEMYYEQLRKDGIICDLVPVEDE